MAERILFSCVGSTDPVRGLHDGSMLHIVRHYRPGKIMWYITNEMKKYHIEENRYNRGIESLKEHIPDYYPEILEPYFDESDDVSDFDAFYDKFRDILGKLHKEYPNAEIIVNLSSGTPQMKLTLAMFAAVPGMKLRAIQVKNPEGKSGTATRTTDRSYDFEAELELNEDNSLNAPNRCSEPKLISIQRDNRIRQVESMLQRYDYAPLLVSPLKEIFSDNTLSLIRHADRRAAYDTDGAEAAARKHKGIELYPAGEKMLGTYSEYHKLSEYILVIKLMQRTERYTDLVIRLNPVTIRMQTAWLKKNGVELEKLGIRDPNGSLKLLAEKIKSYDSKLLDKLNEDFYGEFRDSALSISVCNSIIGYFIKENTETVGFFRDMELLNRLYRNSAAHDLRNTADEDIRHDLGFGSDELVKKLIKVIAEIYPEHYRAELFSIFDTINKTIRDEL